MHWVEKLNVLMLLRECDNECMHANVLCKISHLIYTTLGVIIVTKMIIASEHLREIYIYIYTHSKELIKSGVRYDTYYRENGQYKDMFWSIQKQNSITTDTIPLVLKLC